MIHANRGAKLEAESNDEDALPPLNNRCPCDATQTLKVFSKFP
jgi:hypothetical protein